MIVVIAAVGVVCGLAGACLGVFALRTANGDAQARLRELGLTKASARLYLRAAKILNRMVTVTDLDGDFAADILSPATRKDVEQWLADYRKETNKL